MVAMKYAIYLLVEGAFAHFITTYRKGLILGFFLGSSYLRLEFFLGYRKLR